MRRGGSFLKATRQVDVRLPGKGNSNSHVTRPVHRAITMMRWFRTSRLPITNSLSRTRLDHSFYGLRVKKQKPVGRSTTFAWAHSSPGNGPRLWTRPPLSAAVRPVTMPHLRAITITSSRTAPLDTKKGVTLSWAHSSANRCMRCASICGSDGWNKNLQHTPSLITFHAYRRCVVHSSRSPTLCTSLFTLTNAVHARRTST